MKKAFCCGQIWRNSTFQFGKLLSVYFEYVIFRVFAFDQFLNLIWQIFIVLKGQMLKNPVIWSHCRLLS